MFFYIDESIRGNIFGLGSLCIKIDEFDTVYQAANKLKAELSLEPFHRLKYSLGDNDSIEIDQKKRLKSIFGNDWKNHFRTRIAKLISSLNLRFVATLHEDYRTFKNKKDHATDFYLYALKQILFDVANFVAKQENDNKNNIIIIDKPPQDENKLNERKINTNYTLSLHPYSEQFNYGYIDSLFIANDKYSVFLQLVDFYIGALVHALFLCTTSSKSYNQALQWLSLMKNCLYPLNMGDKVCGVKTFYVKKSQLKFENILRQL